MDPPNPPPPLRSAQAVAHLAAFSARKAAANEPCAVHVVAVELYRENLRDLLLVPTPSSNRGREEHAGGAPAGNRTPDRATADSRHADSTPTPLHVATCPLRGVWVRGAVEIAVDHRDGGVAALERVRAASARRAVGRTGLNADSSRSHLVVGFRVETTTGIEPRTSSSSAKLFLVDLAGCEKAAKSLAAGERLDEAKGINRSLSALGNVVSALVERDRVVKGGGGNPAVGGSSPGGAASEGGTDSPGSGGSPSVGVRHHSPTVPHVPYRDSKLTFLLQESLGGNARATLVVCLSPDDADAPETLSSLRFGARARRVSARLVKGGGGNPSVPGSTPGGAAAEIAALRARVATLTKELAAAAAAARGRIGSIDARDGTRNLPTKFSKDGASGRVRARGVGVLDALTASLGDRTRGDDGDRGRGGGRNEGWAAPIVAGVALSLLFHAIDGVTAA